MPPSISSSVDSTDPLCGDLDNVRDTYMVLATRAIYGHITRHFGQHLEIPSHCVPDSNEYTTISPSYPGERGQRLYVRSFLQLRGGFSAMTLDEWLDPLTDARMEYLQQFPEPEHTVSFRDYLSALIGGASPDDDFEQRLIQRICVVVHRFFLEGGLYDFLHDRIEALVGSTLLRLDTLNYILSLNHKVCAILANDLFDIAVTLEDNPIPYMGLEVLRVTATNDGIRLPRFAELIQDSHVRSIFHNELIHLSVVIFCASTTISPEASDALKFQLWPDICHPLQIYRAIRTTLDDEDEALCLAFDERTQLEERQQSQLERDVAFANLPLEERYSVLDGLDAQLLQDFDPFSGVQYGADSDEDSIVPQANVSVFDPEPQGFFDVFDRMRTIKVEVPCVDNLVDAMGKFTPASMLNSLFDNEYARMIAYLLVGTLFVVGFPLLLRAAGRSYAGMGVMLVLLLLSSYEVMSDSVLSGQLYKLLSWTRQAEETEIDMESVEPQMDASGMTDILGIVYMGLIANFTKFDVSKDLLRQVKDFYHARTGIEDIVTKGIRMLQYVVNVLVCDNIGCPQVRLLQGKIPEVEKLCVEIDTLISEYRTKKIIPSKETHQRICQVIQRAERMYRTLPNERSLDGSKRLFIDHINEAKRIKARCEERNTELSGFRPECVFIMIHGGTNVGKSTLAQHLAVACCRMAGTPEQCTVMDSRPMTFCYVENPKSQFHEGYTPQTLCAISDDFGQLRPHQGMEHDEFLEAIRQGAAFNYPLNMAFQDKGTVHFEAPFKIATTNLTVFDEAHITIHCKEAFERRIHFNIIAMPQRRFAANPQDPMTQWKFDFKKLPASWYSVRGVEKEVEILSPLAQQYQEMDFKGVLVGEPFLYEDLLAKVEEKYLINQAWYLASLDQFTEPLDRERFEEMLAKTRPQNRGRDLFPPEMEDFEELEQHIVNMDIEDHAQIVLTSHRLYRKAYPNAHCPGPRFARQALFSVLGPGDYKSALQGARTVVYEVEGSDSLVSLPGEDEPSERSWKAESFSSRMLNEADEIGAYAETRAMKFYKAFKAFPWKYVIATAAVAISMYGAYRYFSGQKQDESEPQGYGLSDKLSKSKPRQRWHAAKGPTHSSPNSGVVPQMGLHEDPHGYDLMYSVVRNNFFVFEVQLEYGVDKYARFGQCLMLRGRVGIVREHYLDIIAEMIAQDPKMRQAELRIRRVTEQDNAHRCTLEQFVRYAAGRPTNPKNTQDTSIVQFPPWFPLCKDIVKKGIFLSIKDFPHFDKQVPIVMYGANKHGMVMEKSVAHSLDQEITVSKDDYSYTVRNGYWYPIETANGDCNSIICAISPGTENRRILGLHSAGKRSGTTGYCCSLSQEAVEEFLLEHFPIEPAPEETDFIEPQAGASFAPSHMHRVAQIPEHLLPTQNTRTSIVRSPLFDVVFPHYTCPALLYSKEEPDGTILDPMRKAIQEYAIGALTVPTQHIEDACESFFMMLVENSPRKVRKEVLSVREAVYGSPYSDTRPIPHDTSDGWPWKPMKVKWKKGMFSDDPEEAEKCFLEFERLVLETLAKMKEGVRPLFVCADFPKDELRKLAKVLLGDTRDVSPSQIVLVVIMKMYCGRFAEFTILNKITNGMANGVNPYSDDWDLAARLAQQHGTGPNKFAGDLKGFDKRQVPVIQWYCCMLIARWYDYSDEDMYVFSILIMEVYSSNHLYGNTIVEWPGALPSGIWLTFVINCIYNHVCHRLAWICLGNDIWLFNSNVYLCVGGDDVFGAVTMKFLDSFNELLLPEAMLKVCMIYTTELKEIATTKGRTLDQIEFLRRGWRYDTGLGKYVGAKEINSVLERLNWTKRKHSRIQTIRNVNEVLNELSLHDQTVFEMWRGKIQEALEQLMPEFSCQRPVEMSYRVRQRMVCADDCVYS